MNMQMGRTNIYDTALGLYVYISMNVSWNNVKYYGQFEIL